MVVADLETGRFLNNSEISKEMATKKPYKEWIKGQLRGLNVCFVFKCLNGPAPSWRFVH